MNNYFQIYSLTLIFHLHSTVNSTFLLGCFYLTLNKPQLSAFPTPSTILFLF